MPVTAKFRCKQTSDSADDAVGYSSEPTKRYVYLEAVAAPENEAWGGRRVPEGAMSLSVVESALFPFFVAGKNYLITISEA